MLLVVSDHPGQASRDRRRARGQPAAAHRADCVPVCDVRADLKRPAAVRAHHPAADPMCDLATASSSQSTAVSGAFRRARIAPGPPPGPPCAGNRRKQIRRRARPASSSTDASATLSGTSPPSVHVARGFLAKGSPAGDFARATRPRRNHRHAPTLRHEPPLGALAGGRRAEQNDAVRIHGRERVSGSGTWPARR